MLISGSIPDPSARSAIRGATKGETVLCSAHAASASEICGILPQRDGLDDRHCRPPACHSLPRCISRVLRIEAAVKRGDEVKQTRPDKREPEQPDQRAAVWHLSEHGEYAADFVRLARVA